MEVDDSGIHRAHTLASTLAHWRGQLRLLCIVSRPIVATCTTVKLAFAKTTTMYDLGDRSLHQAL